MVDAKQMAQMSEKKGFIAALDQGGGQEEIRAGRAASRPATGRKPWPMQG